MEVGALIIVGGTEDAALENIAGVPIAMLDVMGLPILQRVKDRLRTCGISQIAVVSDCGEDGQGWDTSEQLWRSSQRAFAELAQLSTDLILVLRIGPYLEIDYQDLLQAHVAQASRVTAVVDSSGELIGTFVINASRRNDAAYLLRHRLKTSRLPYSIYEYTGYANPLLDAADLRKLVIDAFCGDVQLTPEGIEIRPGVWADPSAIIHKRARVIAPAYIGAHAKVRAAALVTRCSALEHHVEVDCGTVVDNATILPHTAVGAGLEVANSVVGFRRVNHLGRRTEVEIFDPKLVGTVATAPVRFLGQLASLASYLPLQIARGFSGRRRKLSAPQSVAETVQAPSRALPTLTEDQFPADLVVARRYGNE